MTDHLPIRQWRIRNIKAVERATVDLAPLTVIVGANSSGKTTVLQSMLVVVQAAQAATPGGVLPLNGPLVQLGEYRDAHSAFAGRQASSIAGVFNLGIGHYGERRLADWEIEFSGNAPSQPGSTTISAVSLTVKADATVDAARTQFVVHAKRRAHLSTESLPMMPPRIPSAVAPMPATVVRWPGSVRRGRKRATRTEGVNLIAGLPTHYLLEVDEHEELTAHWLARAGASMRLGTGRALSETLRHRVSMDAAAKYEEAVAKVAADDVRAWLASRPDETAYRDRPEFPALSAAGPRSQLGHKLRHLLAGLDAVDQLRAAILRELGQGGRAVEPEAIVEGVALEPVRLLSERVSYLGPLRQEPQVVYRTGAPGHARFVGTRGEYFAPVFDRLRHEQVTVPMPSGAVEVVTLEQAMNAWLVDLGAATSIDVRYTGRLGYDVRVGQPGLASPVDTTAVGVGVSQVMPVVLICLLAEAGSVVLLEQPELHLHPAMQQRLADFFLALARSGRQLVVETHSEYLITRLRRRIAEDRSSTDDEHAAERLIRIFNASKPGAKTRFEAVPLNRYGSFEAWPTGFFDQAAEDSQELFEAALRKQSESD